MNLVKTQYPYTGEETTTIMLVSKDTVRIWRLQLSWN